MATDAHSIPAPTVQSLLRAAGPCCVLTDADVIALTADTAGMLDASLASVCDALAQTHQVLHRAARSSGPRLDTLETMYLPPLSVALHRRKALFGAHIAETEHA